jgi:ElaB/YqjD/DUF883 family membrane-anchored ribosome-binding protein
MTANEVSTDKLVTGLKRVVRDSEELLKDSAGAVGDKTHDLREGLSQTLESAKATCRRLEQKAIEGAKATDKVIRTHPYEGFDDALSSSGEVLGTRQEVAAAFSGAFQFSICRRVPPRS